MLLREDTARQSPQCSCCPIPLPTALPRHNRGAAQIPAEEVAPMGISVPQNNGAIWELSLHPILCSEQPPQPISGETLEAASECCALRELSTGSPFHVCPASLSAAPQLCTPLRPSPQLHPHGSGCTQRWWSTARGKQQGLQEFKILSGCVVGMVSPTASFL